MRPPAKDLSLIVPGLRLTLLLICTAAIFLHKPQAVASQFFPSSRNVHFQLYPSKLERNFREEIKINDVASLLRSNFKRNTLTVIFVHGLAETGDSLSTQFFKDGYLNSSFAGNLIIMDWGAFSGFTDSLLPTSLTDFIPIAFRLYLPHVTETLTSFIMFLINQGVLSPGNVHLVAHSVGATVAGNAGKLFRLRNYGSCLWRITALDPGPPFPDEAHLISQREKITANDAAFVDIIHSSIVSKEYTGTANFFANGGLWQPNCLDPICNHFYSIQIYIAALFKPYIACKCEPIHPPLFDVVGFEQCMAACPEPTALGPYCPSTAKGSYSIFAPNPYPWDSLKEIITILLPVLFPGLGQTLINNNIIG